MATRLPKLALSTKTMHQITFGIGSVFLIYSIFSAIFLRNPHFYTPFALGSWLVLDFIDYKLNKYSILGFFYNHKHRSIFFIFFLIATVFCIVVDYIFGVKIAGMWEWVAYEPVHFIRMYIFMNASYVLGMYELYRVIKTLLRPRILETHVFKVEVHVKTKVFLSRSMLAVGLLFMLAPLYTLWLGHDTYIEYVMLLPFLSILMVTDSLTYLTGGTPISREIIRGNILKITSLLLTVIVASFVTEILNLFGGEWNYLRMPFIHIRFLDIPVAVFIGWIPLVVSSVAIVNLTTHLSRYRHIK